MKRAEAGGSRAHTRIDELYAGLDEHDRATLIEFAEFLAVRSRSATRRGEVAARPARETVLQAVRRLNRSYPMLDRAKLLHAVGDLLSEHLVDGRDAAAVIDALEERYAAAFGALSGQRRG